MWRQPPRGARGHLAAHVAGRAARTDPRALAGAEIIMGVQHPHPGHVASHIEKKVWIGIPRYLIKTLPPKGFK